MENLVPNFSKSSAALLQNVRSWTVRWGGLSSNKFSHLNDKVVCRQSSSNAKIIHMTFAFSPLWLSWQETVNCWQEMGCKLWSLASKSDTLYALSMTPCSLLKTFCVGLTLCYFCLCYFVFLVKKVSKFKNNNNNDTNKRVVGGGYAPM